MLHKLKEVKLSPKWDQDGYHESQSAVPFALMETETCSHKFCVTERAIWMNETPVALIGKNMKAETVMFLNMLKMCADNGEKITEIPVDWKNI